MKIGPFELSRAFRESGSAKMWTETPLGQSLLAQAEENDRVASLNREGRAAWNNTGARMYASAMPNRLHGTALGSFNTSADLQLATSLRNLRGAARELVRDASFAKSAKRVIVNNVIGGGIRIQAAVAQVKDSQKLDSRTNQRIEDAWDEWMVAENCHTGGKLHFHDLERLMIGQCFEAGEIFLRKWRRPFGRQDLPLALEVVEPERIVDGYATPSAIYEAGTQVRMGIEVDQFRRPIAYWVRDLHPGDIRLDLAKTDRTQRVPAEDMFHLHIVERWPQTRGEPWMASALRKLQDMDGYTEAEIIAARAAANYVGVVQTPEGVGSLGEQQPNNTWQMGIQPGSFFALNPGESLNFVSPNRPNGQLEPFMAFMLREFVAGVGVSYESVSRDYSKSNYSSSRLALLDDRDVWRALQLWFVRSFRKPLHREWLNAAVLSGKIPGIDLEAFALQMHRYEKVRFRPRGWTWIDPTKEVAAYKEAVKAGFTTAGKVIAQTGDGDDYEDIVNARAEELDEARELDLVFDTMPDVYVPAETRGQLEIDPDTGKVTSVQAASGSDPAMPGKLAPAPAKPAAPKEDGESEEIADDEAERRVVRLHRRNHDT